MTALAGDVVLQTLQLLEWRLARIDFILNGRAGDREGEVEGQQSVMKRVGKLEDGLSKLIAKSPAMAEIIALQFRHPEIFESASSATKQDEPDVSTKFSVVITEAPSFPSAVSQLTQLNDLPIPPTKDFTNMIASLPRMAAIHERQSEQEKEISELRKRSALLLLKWHELFVLGQGRCWAEWDGRLKKAEIKVRREEVRKEKEVEAG
ncbi:nuclear distribution protein RO10 [Rhizodiscina lignyota]|uniref:Nuclear distribution protein RO10 n=1 Tax=Rhizodiscina lignyota TaxID=1504668 RepID=A0A9P4MBA8_9PEZI|nr:nuclear distribution protein RO10 [Rhizodiscina lignyota]